LLDVHASGMQTNLLKIANPLDEPNDGNNGHSNHNDRLEVIVVLVEKYINRNQRQKLKLYGREWNVGKGNNFM
jgi:hypothetical protein